MIFIETKNNITIVLKQNCNIDKKKEKKNMFIHIHFINLINVIISTSHVAP